MNSNMQNSKMVFTFSVSCQKHPILLSLRPYGSRDFIIAVVNTAFLFCCSQSNRLCGLFLSTTLKMFK